MRRRIIGKFSRIWQAVKVTGKVDPPFIELLVKIPENEKRIHLDLNFRSTIPFNIDYSSATSKFAYPFEKITRFLREKDLVIVNIETPLTNHTRPMGLFISAPQYAQAMADVGISMVNLANNHIFDAGEIGFLQTIDHLREAGILYIGAGNNLEDARRGTPVQLKDTKFIFLGYTQFCNSKFSSVAAKYPGILPLDRKLIVEDIERARQEADFVFVVLHWGIENSPNVHPKQVEIAHLLIDSGAAAVIGHHPHVPHGIEIYKKKPILYSLGNFIFGQSDMRWCLDNYLAEIVIDQERIQGIMIYPISGQGQELFQPELLSGARSNSLLFELQTRSAAFNTKIAIQNDVGYIKIQ